MHLLKLPLWDFFKSVSPYSYYFGTVDYWLTVFVSLIILGLIIILVAMVRSWIYDWKDSRKATYRIVSGTVIDKIYTPEQTHSGSGTAIVPSSNGGVGVGFVSTSSTTEEEFIIIVRAEIIHKVEVTMEEYYNCEIKDRVKLELKIGGLSNKILKATLQ